MVDEPYLRQRIWLVDNTEGVRDSTFSKRLGDRELATAATRKLRTWKSRLEILFRSVSRVQDIKGCRAENHLFLTSRAIRLTL